MKQQRRVFIFCLPLLFFVSGFISRAYIKKQSDFRRDLRYVSQFKGSFKDITKFFSGIAQAYGAVYAFDVLRAATLPPLVDIHLLGHVIGDVLFIQKGAEGISFCTQEFRNACSHSIVVGLFMRDGEKALSEIASVCRKAPGGRGAYTMCFHGLGHGILAATQYDLKKTVSLCKKTSTPEKSYQEGNECVGGAVMEIISGGFHDREIWERQSMMYLSTPDPLYPCTADFMTAEVKGMCYVYLTPHLLLRAGGTLDNPTEDNWREAMKLCELLPDGDFNKGICFGGFGKEFILVALGKDIRRINEMSASGYAQLYLLCKKAPSIFGINECVRAAVNSLYWGGENDYAVGIKFCQSIDEADTQSVCFENLIGAVFYYSDSEQYLETFCKNVPSKYISICRKK